MIVQCISNKVDGTMPSALREYWLSHGLELGFPLTVGAQYVVVAIAIEAGIPWYYLHDDDDLSWPVWYPGNLFNVVDGSLPPSWVYGYVRISRDSQFSLISFPEWAEDRFFYERLVDGDAATEDIYAARRREIIDFTASGARGSAE